MTAWIKTASFVTYMVNDTSVCMLNIIMGNWTSCCSYSSPMSARKDVNGTVNELPQEGEESVGNLQHISEREQDDWNTDPSVHPKVATIFLERSKVQSTFYALIKTVYVRCLVVCCVLKIFLSTYMFLYFKAFAAKW